MDFSFFHIIISALDYVRDRFDIDERHAIQNDGAGANDDDDINNYWDDDDVENIIDDVDLNHKKGWLWWRWRR